MDNQYNNPGGAAPTDLNQGGDQPGQQTPVVDPNAGQPQPEAPVPEPTAPTEQPAEQPGMPGGNTGVGGEQGGQNPVGGAPVV